MLQEAENSSSATLRRGMGRRKEGKEEGEGGFCYKEGWGVDIVDKEVGLIKRKARTPHLCSKCGQSVGENYYVEEYKDKFLSFLHRRKFCESCYVKYGDELLKKERKGKKRRERDMRSSGQSRLG